MPATDAIKRRLMPESALSAQKKSVEARAYKEENRVELPKEIVEEKKIDTKEERRRNNQGR